MRRNLLLILFAFLQLGIYAIENNASQPADNNKDPKPIPDRSIFHIDDSLLQITCPSACIKPTSRPAIRGVFSHNQRIHFTPNNTNCPYYLIIAENNLYNSLSNEIRTYAEDAHAVFGYGVYVETVQNPTPEEVKSLIISYNNSLRGVFFIGDVGECMYEVSNDEGYGYRNWPCDLFYMDLDGIWTDNDSNGIYDGHTGNVAPEIFLGRLSTFGLSSYGYEEDLIRRQLQKSHYYWWKTSYHAQQTTLNYIDKDWEELYFNADTIKTIFSTQWITDIRHDSISNYFSVSDYLYRINSTTYGFTQLASHSDPVQHYFIINGNIYDNIYNYDIKNINSSNYAYNLFCCSACNWLGANTNGYMGGAYLFNNGKTMTVIGSTKTGGMYTIERFYPALITKNIGEAYLQWWNSYENNHDNTTIHWNYGMTILGDPIIDFRYNVSDLCVNNLSLTSFPSDNNSNLVLYRAGNKITVSDNFTIPQGVHVIFDAPQVIFDTTFTCPLGASFETRSEGCEL